MLAAPELSDLATCDADDVYPAHGHTPARRRHTHELVTVRAAHAEATDDLIAFGDQILASLAQVRNSGPPRGDQRGQSFAPGRRTREGMMVDEVLREQLGHRLQVPLVQSSS